MTDDELRDLVREAVQRHLAARGTAAPVRHAPASGQAHASFARYALRSGSEIDGPCLIEPAVRCNHCGYCLSHGY